MVTNPPTNTQTYRQGRLQYIVPQLERSVITCEDKCEIEQFAVQHHMPRSKLRGPQRARDLRFWRVEGFGVMSDVLRAVEHAKCETSEEVT